MGPCPALDGDAFLASLLGFIDCQAQTIGSGGYQALAAPGSTLSLLLTGMLTLFVAFFGYRMLLGHAPSVRDGVMALVKIGVVLALATSWPAYRALVYDTAFHGPAELAEDVGRPAGIPGAGGGLVTRLGYVDNALRELERLGPGKKETGKTQLRSRMVNGQSVMVAEAEQEPSSIFDGFALGASRLVFLTATIAGMASVRVVAGLLLALGPFFIAFLLFEGTRSLFEGWIRGLGAAALGALGVTLLLGIELALIEPWLVWLVGQRENDLPITGAPTQLLVVALIFALALLGVLAMAARVAIAFRLPAAWRATSMQIVAGLRGEQATAPRFSAGREHVPAEQRSRAAAVAEAVAASQRRETIAQLATAGAPSRAATSAPARDLPVTAPVPLGQTSRRRTQTRVSASAGRRDYRG